MLCNITQLHIHIVGETCNQSHGYIVWADGKEFIRTTDKYVNFSGKYEGKKLEWYVVAYVGDKERSSPSKCSTYMCIPTTPTKAVVNISKNQDVTDKDGEWTLTWEDTNSYNDTCNISTTFSYNVVATEKETGAVVYTAENLSDTRHTLKFNKSGTYVWKITVNDSVSTSEDTEGVLKMCIPSEIE